MKIIDIILDAACLLGLTDEQETIKTINADNEKEILEKYDNIASLSNLVNFSIRELCTNYVPVMANLEIETSEKSYPLSALENFIRVQNVYRNDEMVKFKIINRNIVFEEDGNYVVTYATYPTITTVFQDFDFLDNFSPDVLVFGLSAYYALAHGMFEEFKDFHERYINKAESLKNLKIFDMPSRRWQ